MTEASSQVNVGIIGCGNISAAYLKACRLFRILNVVAVADLDLARASARAEEYGVKALSVGELLEDPEVEIAVNLTIPKAHAEVSLAALGAGKHVYSEKPLATSREDGRRVLELAAEKGLRVGCAPDTFLGGGLQTCRKAIDDGLIGRPVAATAFMMSRGPESWHPDPGFFYQHGAGPMFDMGPYYLTALISFMGPVCRVTASQTISFPERVIGSEPLRGQVIKVEAATLIAGVLDFAEGGIGTIITSFDVWSSNLPRLEIYGSEGSLSVPDPNTFRGPVRLRRAGEESWRELPLTHLYIGNSRGLGVADMAHAIRSGRPHRAGGKMAYHVLDIMSAFGEASKEGRHVVLESLCERPQALPVGLPEGILDD